MKKLISLVYIFAVFAASLIFGVFAASAEVPYIEASSWAVPELEKAEGYGFISDKIKDRMDVPITREELAELAVKLYEKSLGIQASAADPDTFSDTDNIEVLKAYNLMLVNGTDSFGKRFSPEEPATREQVAVMLYRAINAMRPGTDLSEEAAAGFSDEKEISAWAIESVKFMAQNGFLRGYNGRISPKETCTREMAVLITARVYEKYASADGSVSEDSAEASDLSYIVINDMEIFKNDYSIREERGSEYVFIAAEKFKYAFKWPSVGFYTYPEVDSDYDRLNVLWKDEEGKTVLKVDMKEGNDEALINGVRANIGMAPYIEYGKLFVPVNFLLSAMGMEIETSSEGNILYIQYKNNFPQKTLAGIWSDVDNDLFASFKDITELTALLPSFATAYLFNADGTYGLRMASVGGANDTFILQKGKYKIMGSTIMFYDVIETIYKGSPLQPVYEDKVLDKLQYGFIGNYNALERRIEIGGMWLNKR